MGGPHSFLYVVGGEHAPVRVTLALPAGWKIATGLDSAAAPHTFVAPGAEALIDSPIMVGLFRDWRFTVDGVPHTVAYLGKPSGVSFDTALFVGNVERLARETARMFGKMPYHKFQFLFEDGAFGGLEHLTPFRSARRAPGSPPTRISRSARSRMSFFISGTKSTFGRRRGSECVT